MTQTSETTKKSPESIQDMLGSIEELPSIPETLMEIIKVLDDPDSGPSDLAEVIRFDAPLMAKVLRLANSPYYSSRGDLTDINRCVAVLGYRTVRQVAICITVSSSLVGAVSRCRGRLDYRELWRHSVITGALAKYLARLTGYPDPEEIFTAGLLHDLGKFILEVYDPEGYDQVIKERPDSGLSLTEMEIQVYGFDHAAIAAVFGQAWRFPELLSSCLGDHHQKSWSPSQERVSKASALVSLADNLAHSLEPSRSDLGYDPALVDLPPLLAAVGLEAEALQGHEDALRGEIVLASGFLDLN